MIRRPPRSTRTDTLVPYTTLVRSLREDDRIHALHALRQPFADDPVMRGAVARHHRLERAFAQMLDDLDLLALLGRDPADEIGGRVERGRQRRHHTDPAAGRDRLLGHPAIDPRSEERRGGKGGVSTGMSWWSPYH